MMKLLTLYVFCLTASVAVLAEDVTGTLSERETEIVAEIDRNLPLDLKLLEDSVNINSGTLNFAGVHKVGHLFKAKFDELGFETSWIDGKEFDRAGHLLASHGSTGVRILMIGHLDTVFSKKDTFQSYEKIDSERVKGPGITDMKGGNVIILSALRALKETGVLDQVSIRVVLIGDEERSGKPLSVSRKVLIDAAKWADISLGFEDGDGNVETAVIARRGFSEWELNVTGKAAHSSQIFTSEIGFGAVFETARILDSFRQNLAGVGNLTFNPGLIVGGTEIEHDPGNARASAFGKNNVIAKSVRVGGEIRALSPEELTAAKQTMNEIASDNLPHTSASLSFTEGYPPMAPSEGNRQLLKRYSGVSQDLGYGIVRAVNPRDAGAADISLTAEYVDMSLDGLGLMGTGGHTQEETADINTLQINAHKAAVLISRLAE